MKMSNIKENERRCAAQYHLDLRGSVNGWNVKSCVFGMFFYRFTSENLTSTSLDCLTNHSCKSAGHNLTKRRK